MKPRHAFLFLVSALLVGAASLLIWGCGDDDDDDSDQSDDDSDDDLDISGCTDQDVCARNVECNIVDSVAQCIENIDSCPDRDAYVTCMCACQAQFTDCSIESCIPQCADACNGA